MKHVCRYKERVRLPSGLYMKRPKAYLGTAVGRDGERHARQIGGNQRLAECIGGIVEDGYGNPLGILDHALTASAVKSLAVRIA